MEGGRKQGGINKKSIGGCCFTLCQFGLRVIGHVVTCHSKKAHYKNRRNTLQE